MICGVLCECFVIFSVLFGLICVFSSDVECCMMCDS